MMSYSTNQLFSEHLGQADYFIIVLRVVNARMYVVR